MIFVGRLKKEKGASLDLVDAFSTRSRTILFRILELWLVGPDEDGHS